MKLVIFKSTILALVYTVYTSEVNAIEEPILRGYDPNVRLYVDVYFPHSEAHIILFSTANY
jgi:hypothetical protein